MLSIAISGRAKSGKNTIASILARDIFQLKEYQYTISAFANKIKELTEIMFPGCDLDALYGASELRQNKIKCALSSEFETTYRQVNIDLGKLGRTYTSHFWVSHIENEYSQLGKEKKLYIIADARFREEMDWLKENKFKLIRVKRNDAMFIDDISETGQDSIADSEFDYIINNNNSLDYLVDEMREIFKDYRII